MKVSFTPAALRQWLKLQPDVRRRIDEKLIQLAATGQGDVKKLRGRPGARLRVGDWRLIFDDDGETLTVIAVGHRGETYD